MADSAQRPTVYIETTIPSYLTAWPSRDLRRMSHQEITRTWWKTAASYYQLAVSAVVIEECGRGDKEAALARLAVLQGIDVLARSKQADELSVKYIELLRLPEHAAADAAHIAYATIYELDYLVTWNMRHLASSFTMRQLTEYNLANGLTIPLIVTPEALETSSYDDSKELNP